MLDKIDVLIDCLHTGGVEKIALSQVKALNEIGKKSSLYVLKRNDFEDHPFKDLIDKVNVIFLDDRLPDLLKISFKFPLFSFFSLYHLTYPLFLPFVIKNNEFEGLVVHGTYTTFTALGIRLLKGFKFYTAIWDPVAYIIQKAYPTGIIHDLRFILVPLGRLLDWVVVAGAEGVLVGGKPHIDYLKTLGVKRIDIIYPGVNPIKEPSRHKEKYILAMTAWKEGKKPEYNIDIVEKLPGVNMIMAGSWYPKGLEDQFRDIVKTRKMEDRIKITGSISEEELQTLYSKALAFLQTNDDRGFGMPAMESASCGTTFVIPVGQGVCELFEDGVDGFYTNERDTETIVERLSKLSEDPQLASKMGNSAWEKVVENYSWEEHAKKLFEVTNS